MKRIICLFFLLFFVSSFIFAEEKESLAQSLEKELTIEVEELNERLAEADKIYQTYRGLAISGYTMTGVGLGFMILDSLVATPKEDPKSTNKLNELTWSGIPIMGLGVIFSVAFHIMQEKANEAKLQVEGNLYDAKSELDLLLNQQGELTEAKPEKVSKD